MTNGLAGVEFDLAREEGNGTIVSVDLHGEFDLDQVEAIFDALVRDGELCDEFGVVGPYLDGDEQDPDEVDGGVLMVGHFFRVDVPADDPDEDDGDWTAWDYLPLDAAHGRSDGVVVTRLDRNTGWCDRMCWQHPFEPAVVGLPVSQHPDFERWARGTYLYCCRVCADQLQVEERACTAVRMEHYDRLKGRGLRDSFSSRGILPARLWEAPCRS